MRRRRSGRRAAGLIHELRSLLHGLRRRRLVCGLGLRSRGLGSLGAALATEIVSRDMDRDPARWFRGFRGGGFVLRPSLCRLCSRWLLALASAARAAPGLLLRRRSLLGFRRLLAVSLRLSLGLVDNHRLLDLGGLGVLRNRGPLARRRLAGRLLGLAFGRERLRRLLRLADKNGVGAPVEHALHAHLDALADKRSRVGAVE